MIIYELPQATEGLAGGAEYVNEGPGDRASGQRKGRRAAGAELLGALLCVPLDASPALTQEPFVADPTGHTLLIQVFH